MIQVKENTVKPTNKKPGNIPQKPVKQVKTKPTGKPPEKKEGQKPVVNHNKMPPKPSVGQNKITQEKKSNRPSNLTQDKPSVQNKNTVHKTADTQQKKNKSNTQLSINDVANKIHTSGVGTEMRDVNSIKEFFIYLKNKFFNKAQKPYYLVPPCPACGSYVTGRFFNIKRNEYDNQWIIKEGLKNGEILSPVEKLEYENVFCVECGNTWHYDINASWFTYSQIEVQKEMRGTRELLREIKLNEMEEQPQKQGLFSGVKRYMGHI